MSSTQCPQKLLGTMFWVTEQDNLKTELCLHPWFAWDTKSTNKPSYITSRIKTQCIYFPLIQTSSPPHTHTLTVADAVCLFSSQCKTPWGGEDLLKWRSSIAPLLSRFPNKPHLASPACSSQITHNRRAIANICSPHTRPGAPLMYGPC